MHSKAGLKRKFILFSTFPGSVKTFHDLLVEFFPYLSFYLVKLYTNKIILKKNKSTVQKSRE